MTYVLSGELRIAVEGRWAVLDAGESLRYTVIADGLPSAPETVVMFVGIPAAARRPAVLDIDEAQR